jgi:hemoglobin-like flavoprotein
MVEHFFKWLELVPLLDCNNEGITYAFFDRMLNRFGALIKVFIDQNTKFHREFQKLCEKALIDHWTISQDHFKANGLIKQIVKMVK